MRAILFLSIFSFFLPFGATRLLGAPDVIGDDTGAGITEDCSGGRVISLTIDLQRELGRHTSSQICAKIARNGESLCLAKASNGDSCYSSALNYGLVCPEIYEYPFNDPRDPLLCRMEGALWQGAKNIGWIKHDRLAGLCTSSYSDNCVLDLSGEVPRTYIAVNPVHCRYSQYPGQEDFGYIEISAKLVFWEPFYENRNLRAGKVETNAADAEFEIDTLRARGICL